MEDLLRKAICERPYEFVIAFLLWCRDMGSPVSYSSMTVFDRQLREKKERIENVSHKWSGWPGAHCLVCGAEDPDELAMADGWLILNPSAVHDEPGITWDTEEHRLIVEAARICPGATQKI